MNNNPEIGNSLKSNTTSMNPVTTMNPVTSIKSVSSSMNPVASMKSLATMNPFSNNKDNVDIPSGSETESDTETESGVDSGSPIKKDSSMTFKILIAITILGLIGINLFGYAGIIVDKVNDFTGPILRKLTTLLGFYSSETVKTTVSTAAEGTKLLADTTKNITTSVIDTAQEQTAALRDELEETDADIDSIIKNRDIIPEVQRRKERKAIMDNDGNPITDKQTNGVEGWCYIGKDNGLRQCVEVGVSDTCISGEIFPTNEVCINPSLRY